MDSIDNFLATMPKEKKEQENQNSGLCLRYSVSSKKWIVAYGISRNKHKSKRTPFGDSSAGMGETPMEAALDFIEKIRTWKEELTK